MKKILLWTLLGIYIVISVLVTIYLLNYNDYAVSEIGKTTILVMDDDIGDFNKNDLVFVKKNDNKDIAVGDYIFFYDTSDIDKIISYGKVSETWEVHEEEMTFTMNDKFPVSSQNVMGKGETSFSIAGIGSMASLLSSQWGFMFLIIVPMSILFVWQVSLFKAELKKQKQSANQKE